jgi:hypothetical protein
MRSGPLGRVGDRRDEVSSDVGDNLSDDAGEQPDGSAESHPDPRVEQALSAMSELDELDVADHAARYDQIHRALAGALEDAPADEQTDQ